ncbi:CPBP family intramembrane glutamic endopeptidase [Clostridium scatologenes]|uniref:CAAX amino terminal protease family protein n=1 Tax=Clostridium scatologenes TaxID=1548 RepID=A0A0E3M5Z1_CLOSL|nr:CAAX amino terminal protease family protein [Clostridium scatologenes]
MFLIVYNCAIGPIIEEFVFRGVILGGLLKGYDSKIAVFISSILFGLLHFNIYQFIIAFSLGLLLGYIYTRTRSIYLCILMHVLNNSLSNIPNYYYLKYAQLLNYNVIYISLFTVIGLIIILLAFRGLTPKIK